METGKAMPRAAWYLAALFIVMAFAFYFSVMPLISKKREFRGRVDKLKEEIATQQELHQKLQKERRLLEENDPTYLEKYARDNFGWAREGEIIYKQEKKSQ
ncbi:MAG: septum formation initiator family protein [Candidatus Aureabacteria bacterium]|nr:septum formation initiator family protein [Candidatus Auribacterota bacterium]